MTLVFTLHFLTGLRLQQKSDGYYAVTIFRVDPGGQTSDLGLKIEFIKRSSLKRLKFYKGQTNKVKLQNKYKHTNTRTLTHTQTHTHT